MESDSKDTGFSGWPLPLFAVSGVKVTRSTPDHLNFHPFLGVCLQVSADDSVSHNRYLSEKTLSFVSSQSDDQSLCFVR